MTMVTCTIDGRTVRVQEGSTLLDAAKACGVKIPTLCYLEKINEIAVCRVCVVEVVGEETLQASCVTPVREGMVVYTQTPLVRHSRRTTVELILSNHPYDCPTCLRNGKCELQDLVQELDLDMYHTVYARPDFPFNGAMSENFLDDSSDFLVYDPAKCLLCQRCVAICREKSVHALEIQKKSFETVVGPANATNLADACCVKCGRCVEACPTGALLKRKDIDHTLSRRNEP